jgi:putative transposase
MWGYRKIAWLCRHNGLRVSDATCLRVLCDSGLVLPVDYVRERRDLAKARREAFVTIPTRRNRVWQTDFFELETSGGGTWRSGDVIDYATKLVLAGAVTATQTTRDAIAAIEDARCHVHDLLGHALLDDITCTHTGQITPVIVVSDNGPCYKSHGFARYIASRPELTHVRTRRRSPQTNGVIERYGGELACPAIQTRRDVRMLCCGRERVLLASAWSPSSSAVAKACFSSSSALSSSPGRLRNWSMRA